MQHLSSSGRIAHEGPLPYLNRRLERDGLRHGLAAAAQNAWRLWRRSDEHSGRGVRGDVGAGERVSAVAHEERVLEDLLERRPPARVEREHATDEVLTLGARSAQPLTCEAHKSRVYINLFHFKCNTCLVIACAATSECVA